MPMSAPKRRPFCAPRFDSARSRPPLTTIVIRCLAHFPIPHRIQGSTHLTGNEHSLNPIDHPTSTAVSFDSICLDVVTKYNDSRVISWGHREHQMNFFWRK